jgi:hypothetical protein
MQYALQVDRQLNKYGAFMHYALQVDRQSNKYGVFMQYALQLDHQPHWVTDKRLSKLLGPCQSVY